MSLPVVIWCVVDYDISDVISDVVTVARGAAVVMRQVDEDRQRDIGRAAAAAVGAGVSVVYSRLLFETVRKATFQLRQNEEKNQFPWLASERVEL